MLSANSAYSQLSQLDLLSSDETRNSLAHAASVVSSYQKWKLERKMCYQDSHPHSSSSFLAQSSEITGKTVDGFQELAENAKQTDAVFKEPTVNSLEM